MQICTAACGKCLTYPYNLFICLRCPFHGATLYNDSVDMVIVILNPPSVMSHCAVLIIDIYFTLSSPEMNSKSSNSG